jgi:hypothetical protein
MNARTAPPGYQSNFAAMMALIKFGFDIWSCAQMRALLFHAERSIGYGRESDKHSESQALEGIYSTQSLEWVRGPCGLSRAGWYQANAELAIDPEDPAKTPNGVLRRRSTGGGRKQIVEYEIDWLAVKARIDRWKTGENLATVQGKKGSRNWTLSAPEKGPEIGPFPEKGSRNWTPVENSSVESKDAYAEKGSRNWTLHTLDTTDGLKSPSVSTSEGRERVQKLDPFETGPFSVSRDMLNLEMELACGERARTDGPTDLILKVNEKLRLPAEVIVRFLHWKAGDFRTTRPSYHFNPQLLAKSFADEIIRWVNANRPFVAQCQQRVELERQRKAEVTEMPAPTANPAPEPVPPAVPAPVSPLEALLQAEDDRAFESVTKKRRAAKTEAPPPPSNLPEKPEVPPAVDHEERAAYDEREASRRATEAALAAARKAEAEERRATMQKIMRARA